MNSAPKKRMYPNGMADPSHPIYGILKVFLALAALTVILYFSANRFDNTEIETIGWFAMILGIIQGGHEVTKYLVKK